MSRSREFVENHGRRRDAIKRSRRPASRRHLISARASVFDIHGRGKSHAYVSVDSIRHAAIRPMALRGGGEGRRGENRYSAVPRGSNNESLAYEPAKRGTTRGGTAKILYRLVAKHRVEIQIHRPSFGDPAGVARQNCTRYDGRKLLLAPNLPADPTQVIIDLS